MSNPPIIEVKDLVKHFPRVQAVNNINLSIDEGVCFGLLGPNGAGKTTTVEMIEGIIQPTSGDILYRNEPIGHAFREKAGIQFQKTTLPDYLTVKEVIYLFRSFYKHPLDVSELVRLCALEELLERDTHKISGGQLQRVLLALALVNDPDVIFLDEPTTGLDPQARRNFWDLVKMIKARKKTIVLTTHYMEEAYILCDRIAIMDRGLIIAQGSPDQLLKQYFEGVLIQIPRQDFKTVRGVFPWHVIEKEDVVEIETVKVNETLEALIKAGAVLDHMKIRSHSLEDLFLELTGKDLRH